MLKKHIAVIAALAIFTLSSIVVAVDIITPNTEQSKNVGKNISTEQPVKKIKKSKKSKKLRPSAKRKASTKKSDVVEGAWQLVEQYFLNSRTGEFKSIPIPDGGVFYIIFKGGQVCDFNSSATDLKDCAFVPFTIKGSVISSDKMKASGTEIQLKDSRLEMTVAQKGTAKYIFEKVP